ncbi:MAG: hypothetical protein JWM82_2910 [Myxococcales bacterium]|nr:hypothetical protein [Myxococcales bacterium]
MTTEDAVQTPPVHRPRQTALAGDRAGRLRDGLFCARRFLLGFLAAFEFLEISLRHQARQGLAVASDLHAKATCRTRNDVRKVSSRLSHLDSMGHGSNVVPESSQSSQ